MLAVLTLVAAVLVPMLINQNDLTARGKEQATLQAMGAGLQRYAMRTRSIPEATNLLALVGAEIGLSSTDATATPRKDARVVLIDPDLHIGQYSGSSTISGGLLPYTQTNSGSKKPLSPRIMIVSSLGAALPSTLVSGIAANATFTNLWSTAPDKIPSLWSWSGKGEDLKIQRINMEGWFTEVALNQGGSLVGRYALDMATKQNQPPPTGSIWMIIGTTLSLYSHPGGSDGFTVGLQTTEIIDRSLSFTYESDGVWRGHAFSTSVVDPTLSDLQGLLDAFSQAPENPRASYGTTKADMLGAFQAYMDAYKAWAAASYPATGSLKTAASAAADTLATKTSRLLNR